MFVGIFTRLHVFWHPDLRLTADGRPLAVRVSDLIPSPVAISHHYYDDGTHVHDAIYGTFPFRRVLHHEGLDFWLRPTSPILVGIFFLVARAALGAAVRAAGVAGEGRVADAYKASFDLGIFAFSALACVNLALLLYNHHFYYGALAVYCDRSDHLWHKGFGAWTTARHKPRTKP